LISLASQSQSRRGLFTWSLASCWHLRAPAENVLDYSLNFHSWRHMGQMWLVCCECSHFMIQCIWKQCEHCPHTETTKTRRSCVKLTWSPADLVRAWETAFTWQRGTTDGRTDGRTDGWTDGHADVYLPRVRASHRRGRKARARARARARVLAGVYPPADRHPAIDRYRAPSRTHVPTVALLYESETMADLCSFRISSQYVIP